MQHTSCVFLCIAMSWCILPAHSKETKANSASGSDTALFSLGRTADIRRLQRMRELAINESVRTLKKHAVGELRDRELAVRAATLLGELRDDSEPTLSALCDNITLKSQPATGFGSIAGFVAAEAIVQIGSPRAQQAVLQLSRRTNDEKKRLLCACILEKTDTLQAVIYKVEQAIESEKKKPLFQSGPDLKYINNLVQIKEWLIRPEFLRDPHNWPATRF